MCQRDVRPPVQIRWSPRAFSSVSTEDSDIHSSCEIKDDPAFKPLQWNRPSFESGHYGVHSTWGRNHRVPFKYVFLWELSSWFACGKLAYFLHIILGILSLLKMIWHPCSLLRVPVLTLVFLQIWDGCLRETLELPKVRQATFLLWWGMGDCSRSNKAESGIISNWFGIEQTVSHFFVISVSF